MISEIQVKVLLADEVRERASTLADRLAGVATVVRPAPGERLVEAVRRARPDVVVVDMSDRASLEPIREATAEDPTPIVLFTDSDERAFMEQAIEAGVCSYNVHGASMPDIHPILRTAVALFRRHQLLVAALKSAEARLHDQSVIQRAKRRLMQECGISEPQAHRWLQRRAMNSGARLAEVARQIVNAGEAGAGQ